MHGSNHEDMVLLGLRSLMLPTLISVMQRVVGQASNVFASACATLLH